MVEVFSFVSDYVFEFFAIQILMFSTMSWPCNIFCSQPVHTRQHLG
jgi:hypothetical protein